MKLDKLASISFGYGCRICIELSLWKAWLCNTRTTQNVFGPQSLVYWDRTGGNPRRKGGRTAGPPTFPVGDFPAPSQHFTHADHTFERFRPILDSKSLDQQTKNHSNSNLFPIYPGEHFRWSSAIYSLYTYLLSKNPEKAKTLTSTCQNYWPISHFSSFQRHLTLFTPGTFLFWVN